MKILVTVPTYNEVDNIGYLIERLLEIDPNIEVLVVDDNSPDKTGDLTARIADKNPRVHLISRPKKEGLGTAYVAGFRWALERDYGLIFGMDGDGSHSPKDLPKFLEAMEDSDVVVGSRWIKGGAISHWSFHRVLLSRIANLYARMVLGVHIRDLTAGFICYKREVLESIDLNQIRSDGYSFLIEMKYRALKKHFRVREIPVLFTDRKKGKSKISRAIVLHALWIVWFLKLTVK